MRPIHQFFHVLLALAVGLLFTGCGGSSSGGGGGGDGGTTPPPVLIVLDTIEFNTATSVPSGFAATSTPETVLTGHGEVSDIVYVYTYAARTVEGVPGLEVTKTADNNVEVYVFARSTNGQIYSIYAEFYNTVVVSDPTIHIAGPGVAPALFLPLNADGALTVGTVYQHSWIPGGTLRTWEVAAVNATSQGGVAGATGIRDVETDDYFWFVPTVGSVEWAFDVGSEWKHVISIAPEGPG